MVVVKAGKNHSDGWGATTTSAGSVYCNAVYNDSYNASTGKFTVSMYAYMKFLSMKEMYTYYTVDVYLVR
jgi:hypothetical protein